MHDLATPLVHAPDGPRGAWRLARRLSPCGIMSQPLFLGSAEEAEARKNRWGSASPSVQSHPPTAFARAARSYTACPRPVEVPWGWGPLWLRPRRPSHHWFTGGVTGATNTPLCKPQHARTWGPTPRVPLPKGSTGPQHGVATPHAGVHALHAELWGQPCQVSLNHSHSSTGSRGSFPQNPLGFWS